MAMDDLAEGISATGQFGRAGVGVGDAILGDEAVETDGELEVPT